VVRMELRGLSRDALRNNPGVPVDEDRQISLSLRRPPSQRRPPCCWLQ
jgi:hypothetical protein